MRFTSPPPYASFSDSLAVALQVALPTIAKGVIIRRPRAVALARRMELDRRAVERMSVLRERYGPRPLLLAMPGKRRVLILSPDDARTVLEGSPRPYSPASDEKNAALAHFEPKVALTSSGSSRTLRRRFNENVLDSGSSTHRLTDVFVEVVDQEMRQLAEASGPLLTWDGFAAGWFRIVRRVVLGDASRDDEELTELLDRLRSRGNWAFLAPRANRSRQRLLDRIGSYLERDCDGSLAGLIAASDQNERIAPEHQVAHWLFAFDPAGMATARALALLASHPPEAMRARDEIRAAKGWRNLTYLRGCVLEALRLWPTTPMILRQTSRDTWLNGVHLPADTGILIFAPFFHRDPRRLHHADRFAPEIWPANETALLDDAMVPFSGGPGRCPARHLVLLVASAALAALLMRRDFVLQKPELHPGERLPATLNHFELTFRAA